MVQSRETGTPLNGQEIPGRPLCNLEDSLQETSTGGIQSHLNPIHTLPPYLRFLEWKLYQNWRCRRNWTAGVSLLGSHRWSQEGFVRRQRSSSIVKPHKALCFRYVLGRWVAESNYCRYIMMNMTLLGLFIIAKMECTCEVWGSHSCDYEDIPSSEMWRHVAWYLSAFWRNLLPTFPILHPRWR
jgi:hypothetical protein